MEVPMVMVWGQTSPNYYKNQGTDDPVNAHLTSGPRISTQHTNPK